MVVDIDEVVIDLDNYNFFWWVVRIEEFWS